MSFGIELRVLCMSDKERPLSYISNPKQFSFNTNASVPAITFYLLLFASYKTGIVSDGLQGFSLMFPGPTLCCLN